MRWLLRLIRRLMEKKKPEINLTVSQQWLNEHKVRTDKKDNDR